MKKNEFYRESTPGSRIKNTAKKIFRNISKVVDPVGIYPKIGEKIRTGFKKPSSFKLRSGNKPSIAKLAGVKRDPKDPFFVIPKGPEVKDNMPKMSPKELQKIIKNDQKFPSFNRRIEELPDFLKNKNKKKQKGVHGYTITKDIKKRK